LSLAALFIAGLGVLNFVGVRRLLPYLVLGALLWVSVLKSGVHATLAGVVLALFIPLKSAGETANEPEWARPAIRLEHVIKPWSAWFIMPVFAFANAGLPLGGLSLASLAAPLPLGIMAGLFVGKQVGIMLGAGLLIVLGIAALPPGATWRGLYGVAILGGIGFTMSLFIGTLAFPDDATREAQVRLGVLAGSILSALAGWAVLRSQRKSA
jgi:Na+:H+ antiporter, NhaA family